MFTGATYVQLLWLRQCFPVQRLGKDILLELHYRYCSVIAIISSNLLVVSSKTHKD
jgi:hypothetical protein